MPKVYSGIKEFVIKSYHNFISVASTVCINICLCLLS